MVIFFLVVLYVVLLGGGYFVTQVSTIGWTSLNFETDKIEFDRSGWFEEYKLFLSLMWGLIVLVLITATIIMVSVLI